MKVTITPIQDIDCSPYEFTGRDGKPVTIYTGRGVANAGDPIVVRVSAKKPCKLVALKPVEVVLREYSSKDGLHTARVSVP